MRQIIIILLFINVCEGYAANQSLEKIKNNKADSTIHKGLKPDSIEKRDLVLFEPDSVANRSYIIRKFNKDIGELKASDISSIGIPASANIHNLGTIRMYRIVLSEALPEVFKKSCYLIVARDRKRAALLLLDTIILAKTSVHNDSALLGGVDIVKDHGFYKVYELIGIDKLVEILNSRTCCKEPYPVFNNSIDCLSYSPFMLNLKKTDINNDGLLDINFSGRINSYCKGLETGYGRTDRKPISTKNISFSFLLQRNKANRFSYRNSASR